MRSQDLYTYLTSIFYEDKRPNTKRDYHTKPSNIQIGHDNIAIPFHSVILVLSKRLRIGAARFIYDLVDLTK